MVGNNYTLIFANPSEHRDKSEVAKPDFGQYISRNKITVVG